MLIEAVQLPRIHSRARPLLSGDGVYVPWPHASPDLVVTTLRAEKLRSLLSPHAWLRCIAHADLTTSQVVRLYGGSPGKQKRGQELRRTGRRIIAAGLEEDVVGLNEETIRCIFRATSDRLDLIARIYSLNPKGPFR